MCQKVIYILNILLYESLHFSRKRKEFRPIYQFIINVRDGRNVEITKFQI